MPHECDNKALCFVEQNSSKPREADSSILKANKIRVVLDIKRTLIRSLRVPYGLSNTLGLSR